MDDLKLPVFLLICILGGVGFYFYNKSQNPTQHKVKPKKVIEETISEEVKAEQKAEADLEKIKSAKKSFAKEDYKKTLELLAGLEDKADYDVQRMFAYSYSSQKEYDKSILFFEKTLKIKKIPLDGYSLAYLYEITGRSSAAAGLYTDLSSQELPPNLRKAVFEGIARVSAFLPNNSRLEEYIAKLVKEWPDSKEGVINLIKCKKQNSSFDGIDALAESANKHFSKDYSYNYELAQLYEAAGKYNQAVNYYKKCIKIDSKNYTAFYDCYRNFMKLNKEEFAIKALEYFLESGQVYVSTFFDAAKIAHKNKMYRQAFRLYLASASSDPKIQGLDDGGLVSDIEKVVREKGTETEKVFVNAFICCLNGDYEYAISEINKVKRELDNSVYKNDYKLVLKACDRLAKIDKKRDDDIRAYEEYLKAEEEAKRKASSTAAATGNSEFKNYTDKDLINRALKNISNFDIQIETAMEFVRRGKNSDAKVYFRNASDINRKSHIPYCELAKINLMEGSKDLAKKNIETALKYNPNNVDCLSLGASIYYNSNDTLKAQQCAESALKSSPNNTSSRIVLAKIYLSQKEYDKANEQIDKALSYEKTNMMRAELLRFKRQLKEQKEKKEQKEQKED